MDLVDLVVGGAEPLLEPLEHRARGRARDLEADDVAEAAAAQLELDRLEQVVGLVRDLEVGVASDAEDRPLDDLHPGKEQVEEVRDHVLERQEAAPDAGGEEARQAFGHLHPREALLAALRVAGEHAEAEREPGDVREALAGTDSERRQDREDLAPEPLLERAQLVRVEIGDGGDDDVLLGQCGPQHLLPELRLALGQLEHALADGGERGERRQPVDGADREPGRRLAQEPGDADHEELVQVGRDEAAHLDPLQERQRVVGREVEQPVAVLERRELAVQQSAGGSSLGGHDHRRKHVVIRVTGG